jgi:hypothetical protein
MELFVMGKSISRGFPCAVALLASLATACGVSKDVHCKFVSDVNRGAQHYEEAAKQAENAGWEAEASELKKTVESEQKLYCE